MTDQQGGTPHDAQINAQAQEQTGQRQVRLRIDEAKLNTSYANAFRTHCSAEEMILDFGMNMVTPAPAAASGDGGTAAAGEIIFHASDRIVMNYYTAKRLAVLLGQVVRQYEQRFGELNLNAADRAKDGRG